jgi:hypothetical protein
MGKNNKNINLVTHVKNYILDKRNLPLFFILIIYSYFLLPICFLNNDYFNLLAAFHIDSGSIIGSIFTIMNKNIFYNQNQGYHTSYYGFPYNSLLFIVFVLIRKIFHFSVVNDFPIFAVLARLISFLISIFTICLTYLLCFKIFKKVFFAFLVVVFLAVFPGFSFYSSLIKPDILALLFGVVTFLLIYHYINTNKSFYYISAIVFAALATFTKQQYIFIGFPLIIAYFINNKFSAKNVKHLFISYLKASVIVLPLFFLIHPFAFINFPYFIGRQKELTGMTSTPIIENVRSWISIYTRYPIIIFGFFLSLLAVILYFFHKKNSSASKIIFLLSLFSLIYTLWLTIFVGPFRVNAYLLPVFSFYTIIIFHLFSQLNTVNKVNKNSKLLNILKISLFIILFTIFASSFKLMFKDTVSLILQSYNFKKSLQMYAVNQLMSLSPINQQFSKNKIIFTTSLPVPQYQFKDAKNIWQFTSGDKFISALKSYNPDFIIVDTTQYYEQSYTWWKKTALDLGFTKEKIYLKNKLIQENKLKENETKSVVVIFYK